jgi:hypothetical protein
MYIKCRQLHVPVGTNLDEKIKYFHLTSIASLLPFLREGGWFLSNCTPVYKIYINKYLRYNEPHTKTEINYVFTLISTKQRHGEVPVETQWTIFSNVNFVYQFELAKK